MMANVDFSGSKILIVDDNPANIDILLELLGRFDVRAVLDGEDALEAVKEELPDLILLDITMPGMDGFEVCSRLKADPRSRDIPVIFLTASADDTSIVKGFDLGGVDYITKPYLSREIVARIQTHLKLRRAMLELDKLAYIDELSGISNRRRFFMRSDELFTKAANGKIPMYLFVIDIDKFKTINDTFGHAIGDRVIKVFTAVVGKTLTKLACFARLGGDEFVVILAGMTKEEAMAQMEQLLQNVRTAVVHPEHAIPMTISVGMSEFQAGDTDIDEVMARADLNLYEAKRRRDALVG